MLRAFEEVFDTVDTTGQAYRPWMTPAQFAAAWDQMIGAPFQYNRTLDVTLRALAHNRVIEVTKIGGRIAEFCLTSTCYARARQNGALEAGPDTERQS